MTVFFTAWPFFFASMTVLCFNLFCILFRILFYILFCKHDRFFYILFDKMLIGGRGGRPQREGGGLLSDGLGGVGGQPAKGLGDLGGKPAAEEVLYISTPTRSPRQGRQQRVWGGGRGAVAGRVERSTTTEDTNNYAQSLWPSQALSVGGWPINVRLQHWAPRVCRYQYPRIHNMYNWAHTFKQGHQTNMMRHSTKNIHILSYEGFPRNPNTFA